ncbi:MAG: hypothetical protein DI537_51260 [Stutzerimonas stutzeri]|nr:MAG: hypothetical protein DI537_51260 [Stutzerimonas stutzeri]
MSLPLATCRPQGKLRRSNLLLLLSVACSALAPFALRGGWKVARTLREGKQGRSRCDRREDEARRVGGAARQSQLRGLT